MRSYGGSVIGAQGIQGIKNVDSVLSICASTRRCHVRIETGRQKDGMPKDIDYRIGQEVQSARLVVPNFLSGGSVTFFISKTAHQAVHARIRWDHAALYLSRSTHLELLQLRLLVQ